MTNSSVQKSQPSREEREAAALRENLRRRKAQQQSRVQDEPKEKKEG